MIYNRIMVAVDGSNPSISALKEAIQLAKDQKAKLLIVHVAEDLYVGDTDLNALIAARRAQGHKILNEMKEIAQQSKVDFETQLIGFKSFGRISEQIVEKAKTWPADVLVIGTHGRHGLSYLLIGSVAEGVVRIATTPVLLIRLPFTTD
jgi:nucleotide-binding universal stress UspA family protein